MVIRCHLETPDLNAARSTPPGSVVDLHTSQLKAQLLSLECLLDETMIRTLKRYALRTHAAASWEDFQGRALQVPMFSPDTEQR